MANMPSKGYGPSIGPGIITQGLKSIVKKIVEAIKGAFRHLYRPEKFTFTIHMIGTVIKPFRKTYEIRGKRIIKHILDFIFDEDEELD